MRAGGVAWLCHHPMVLDIFTACCSIKTDRRVLETVMKVWVQQDILASQVQALLPSLILLLTYIQSRSPRCSLYSSLPDFSATREQKILPASDSLPWDIGFLWSSSLPWQGLEPCSWIAT